MPDATMSAIDWPREIALPDGIRSSGVDLGDARRVALALERTGRRFAQRVFCPPEQHGDTRTLATVFSVKESVIKALGGLPRGGRYLDVMVGAPSAAGLREVRLGGELARLAESRHLELVAGEAPLGADVVLTWAAACTGGRS